MVMFLINLQIIKLNITDSVHFAIIQTFFDSFSAPNKNKVSTRCNSLPKTYPICNRYNLLHKSVYR